MSEKSLISIIMPTYNRAHLITESIQSVIEQTYQHWELIIVDDGSSDNTEEVVSNIKDIRIRYYYIDHAGFVGVVRNYGIKKSKGDYIAFLDSDDLWRNDKLDFQLALFERYPESKFIISNGVIFGTSNKSCPDCEALFVGSLFWPILEESRFVIYTPSLILKREILESIGLLSETLAGADMQFFLSMSAAYPGIFTNERLIKIRKHDQNTTEKYGIERYLSSIKMVTEFYRRGSLQKNQYVILVSRYYYKMGLHYFLTSRPKHALHAFWKNVKLAPLNWKGWARLLQAIVLSVKP